MDLRAFNDRATQAAEDAGMKIEPRSSVEWGLAIKAAEAAATAWKTTAERLSEARTGQHTGRAAEASLNGAGQ